MRHRSRHLSDTVVDDDAGFAERIEAAAAGEPSAVRELVEEFEPALTSYARRHGAADPEGLANTTLFGALQSLGTFRGRDRRSFRGLVYRILQRRLVDEIRANAARPRTVPGLDPNLTVALIDDTTTGFDERLADEELVEGLLTQLTGEQRQVLELRLLDDLSIQETADRTGRSIPAVKAMQRRAIVSLRMIAAATTVVLAIVLGLRMLWGSGQQGVIVENVPVDQPVSPQSVEPGPEGEGPDEGALLPSPGDGPIDGSAPAETDASDADADRLVIEGASSSPATVPESESPPETPSDSPPDSGPETQPPPEPEPLLAVGPSSPCVVTSDGTPAAGEMAFVSYRFSGPYELLNKTSAVMIGRSGTSATLTGFGSTDRVHNGKVFPFRITPNMITGDGRFQPRTALAGGILEADCALAEGPAPTPPCLVTTDGNPTPGAEATVTYDPTGPYEILIERWTSIIDESGGSALVGARTREITPGSSFAFTVDPSMINDDGLDVRSSFRSGEAFVRCAVERG